MVGSATPGPPNPELDCGEGDEGPRVSAKVICLSDVIVTAIPASLCCGVRRRTPTIDALEARARRIMSLADFSFSWVASDPSSATTPS
jgi:hypothetical protein